MTGTNILELKFTSGVTASKKERKRTDPEGKLDTGSGDRDRLYLRKAQYHWGWDWGPALNTCGPWKPIYIEKYISRIENVRVYTEVPDQLDSALIKLAGMELVCHRP